MSHDILTTIGMDNLAKKDIVIFLGAGASKDSGLPLAKELQQHLLEVLTENPKDIVEIVNSYLPFEGFMEILFRNYTPSHDLEKSIQLDESSDDVDLQIRKAAMALVAFTRSLSEDVTSRQRDLLQMYELGEPNSNHLIIVELIKQGYVHSILTTNFDLLLEKSLEIEGLKEGDDFRVLYDEEDFIPIELGASFVPIYKIHGSAKDFASIRTMFGQVANRELSNKRSVVLDHIFDTGPHKKILILG